MDKLDRAVFGRALIAAIILIGAFLLLTDSCENRLSRQSARWKADHGEAIR